MGRAQTNRAVHNRAENGELDVLFMTPEKACSASQRGFCFWTTLLRRGVSLLAVEEAQCVSERGHDFRHEYQNLDGLRPFLPKGLRGYSAIVEVADCFYGNVVV